MGHLVIFSVVTSVLCTLCNGHTIISSVLAGTRDNYFRYFTGWVIWSFLVLSHRFYVLRVVATSLFLVFWLEARINSSDILQDGSSSHF